MNKLYVLCPLKEYAFKSTKIAKPSIQAIWRERETGRQTERERERERERDREKERETHAETQIYYTACPRTEIFSQRTITFNQ